MNNILSYIATAILHPRHGVRSVTVSRDHEPVAIIRMAGTGMPTTSALDDALAVLGYTRISPWTDADSGLVCGVEPVRRP